MKNMKKKTYIESEIDKFLEKYSKSEKELGSVSTNQKK